MYTEPAQRQTFQRRVLIRGVVAEVDDEERTLRLTDRPEVFEVSEESKRKLPGAGVAVEIEVTGHRVIRRLRTYRVKP